MVEPKIQQTVEDYNKTAKYKIGIVDVHDLEFLKKNARFMSNDMYTNLVENIRKDAELSSVPFCCVTPEGKYKVLSGNHRAKAAIQAGLDKIPIIYTEEPLSRDRQIAIQLSHNSLTGKDDLTILKSLYDEISDIDWKYYSGLDDKTLETLEKIDYSAFCEDKLAFVPLSFCFLPEEVERLVELVKKISNEVKNDAIIGYEKDNDRFLSALSKIESSYNIHNGATAIMIMLDMVERHYAELKEGWEDENGELKHKNNIPLCTVLETEYVSVSMAQKLEKLIADAVNRGIISKNKPVDILEKLIEKWEEKDNGTTE